VKLPAFRHADLASLAAVPVGAGCVLAGQWLQGGSVSALLHGSAALIVFGGTLGAVLVAHSPAQTLRALRGAVRTFRRAERELPALGARMTALAMRAHRRGVQALDHELAEERDPFLRNGLSLVIDGASGRELAQVLQVERHAADGEDDASARVWESAAGYAPTLGILGAVIGLIEVLQHLRSPDALGTGIATAFVSTVYGVASANLLFLPLAGRVRERAAECSRERELIGEGLLAISDGASPRLVSDRIRPLAPGTPPVEEIAARLHAAVPVRLA